MIFAASTSTASFGAYNSQWDGTSELRELVDERSDSRIVFDTTPYETANATNTVSVILVPTEPYSANESQRLRNFVERGGTVVIADDFGPHSNPLLTAIGADARFSRLQLRDEQEYYRGPSLPLAPNVTTTPYTQSVSQLTLNGATAVEPGNATPIVTSSELAYLDRNATGNLSAGDELGAYPVVTVESIEDGQVITLSDPSIFINSMLAQPDNRLFATQLVTTHDRALLDYSHAGTQPPLAQALVLLRASPLLQVGGGLATLGVWLLVWRRIRVGTMSDALETLLPVRALSLLPQWLWDRSESTQSHYLDAETLRTAVHEEYPELGETQVQQVITAVLSERPRDEQDE
ncbi:hypothetical protein C464_13210 [Halorubrum coriense DSM 10284]|uniref:DUF4350 domain-containing protein n=1 Tax=Halorubrum coriense DSM 10284 TaxID=1227466 RepID=M0EA14_9EURY|nr:hypothetical protein C464_13210 [Halorubrum coriense DSM 10284]